MARLTTALPFLSALLVAPSLAAQAALVRDIRLTEGGTPSGEPEQIVLLNGSAIFVAEDEYGAELWVSNGSVNGTKLLKDLNPGAASAHPDDLVAVGNQVFFSAILPGIGRELCVTDGTTAGTHLVVDLWPGTNSGLPSTGYVTAYNGKYFFRGTDGSNGTELWCSDGTLAGTQMVYDLPTGSGLRPSYLTVSGGALFFQANGGPGYRLWKTLGTAASTQEISPVRYPNGMHDFNGVLLFRGGNLSNSDYELFRSDGTTAGTYLVKEIQAGPSDSYPDNFVNVAGGLCVFSADDGVNGDEIWVTDGTTAGTTMLVDAYAGSGGSLMQDAVEFGGKAYFNARMTTGSQRELWCSDGTVAGTQMVIDLYATQSGNPSGLTVLAGELFFAATDSGIGRELWKTDGSALGTQLVRDIYFGGASSSPDEITTDGTHLWFAARDQLHGIELWRSDGTDPGTVLVADMDTSVGSSNPDDFIDFGGQLGFVASDGSQVQPWITDGTPANTVELSVPGSQSLSIFELEAWNGAIWMNPFVSGLGREFYVSDGTPGGTQIAFEYFVGSAHLDPRRLQPLSSTGMLFEGNGPNGREPWITDGTQAGTIELADIRPGTTSSSSVQSDFVVAGGFAFFAAYDGTTSGTELWGTDGTPAGTVQIADIRPGASSSNPEDLVVLGSSVVFFANDGVSGKEVWISDGTTVGTQLLADIRPGSSSSSPDWLVSDGTRVFFTAYEPNYGEELYVSDGTTAGTQRISDVAPNSAGGDIEDLVVAGGLVFFVANDDVHGDELWVSDGTLAGTTMIMDIGPGAMHGVLRETLGAAGAGALVGFAASDGNDGLQFWTSDGTVGGTIPRTTFGPSGVGAVEMDAPFTAGTQIYVAVDDGVLGKELWVVPLTGAAFLFPFGQGCAGSAGQVPLLDSVGGSPTLGNASFGLRISNALAHAPATTLLSFGPTSIYVSPCFWYLTTPALDLGSSLTDANGEMITSLPMPTDPIWLGQPVIFQSAVIDPNGQLFGDVALSQGLFMSIGN